MDPISSAGAAGADVGMKAEPGYIHQPDQAVKSDLTRLLQRPRRQATSCSPAPTCEADPFTLHTWIQTDSADIWAHTYTNAPRLPKKSEGHKLLSKGIFQMRLS